MLQQYYRDDGESYDEEEGEEEGEEESEEEGDDDGEYQMLGKKKSLAEKMDFDGKRGTLILLGGSETKKISKLK